jgi:hypothetical protein
MRTFVSQLIAILVLLVTPLAGYAGDLSGEQLQAIREIDRLISVVHEVADQQLITKEQAAEAEGREVGKARKIVGRDVSAAEIHELAQQKERLTLGGLLFFFAFMFFVWSLPWLLK